MRKYFVFLLVVGFVMAFVAAPDVKADIINGDFETGDLTGWTTEVAYKNGAPKGWVNVVGDTHVDMTGAPTYYPGLKYDVSPEGNYMAELQGDWWARMSQTFSASEGEFVSFRYNVFAYEWIPPAVDPDYFIVTLDGIQILTVTIDPPAGAMYNEGWKQFVSAPLGAGTHVLTFQAGLDFDEPHLVAYVDSVSLQTPVPPALLLLGSGLLGLLTVRRKFKG